jgi:hypothetical protein
VSFLLLRFVSDMLLLFARYEFYSMGMQTPFACLVLLLSLTRITIKVL